MHRDPASSSGPAHRRGGHRSATIRTDRPAPGTGIALHRPHRKERTARRGGAASPFLARTAPSRPRPSTLLQMPAGDRLLGRIRARHAVGRAHQVQGIIDLAGGFAPTCRPFARCPAPDARRPEPGHQAAPPFSRPLKAKNRSLEVDRGPRSRAAKDQLTRTSANRTSDALTRTRTTPLKFWRQSGPLGLPMALSGRFSTSPKPGTTIDEFCQADSERSGSGRPTTHAHPVRRRRDRNVRIRSPATRPTSLYRLIANSPRSPRAQLYRTNPESPPSYPSTDR
ncbi:hypothetical protein NODU109028_19585 [Nocardioides dubius]